MPKLVYATPKYRLHKQSGRGIVTLRRDLLLPGPYGSPESIREFDRLVAEWLSNHRQPPQPATPANELTVRELLAGYLAHARSHYRKNGRETTEVGLVVVAFRFMKPWHGLSAADFGPRQLKAVRETMIRHEPVPHRARMKRIRPEKTASESPPLGKSRLARKTINGHVTRIRQAFKWGVAEGLLPVTVHQALACVPHLQAGRTDAPDHAPVEAVAEVHVETVRGRVNRFVRAMIDVQVLTGMRPGEVMSMRRSDIDTSGKVWKYTPREHKTQHHRRARVVFIGPAAQAVIEPFLRPELDAHLFSPVLAEAERRAALTAARKTPIHWGNKPGTNRKKRPARTPRDCYDASSYRNAIRRACIEAGIAPWHPHQLRHNAAERLEREHGIEAAQYLLGHASPAMTRVYSAAHLARAEDAALKSG